MIIYTIGLILFIILFLTTSILAILGFFSKPKLPQAIIMNPDNTPEKPSCLQQNIPCVIDDDCKNVCSDPVELKCVTVYIPENQKSTYGETKSFCKPALPSQTCNQEHGGIWVWTGDSESETQGWSCVCAYPGYYGNLNDGCNSLNPGICSQGTFDYNAFTQNTPPNADNCTCGNGYTKIIEQGIPICAPTSIQNFYTSI